MSAARTSLPRTLAAHGVLILYTAVALFPVFVIVINAFKTRRAIFSEPSRSRPRRPGIWSASPPCSARATSCSTSRTA